MKSALVTRRRIAATLCLLGVAGATLIGWTPGCIDQTPSDGGNGTPQPTGECLIVNFAVAATFRVSTGSLFPLTVLYNMEAGATNVRGFYVEVGGPESGAPEIGDEVVVAANLQAGDNRAFDLDVSLLTEGYFKVGIRGLVGETELRCVSTSTLEATESLLPEFIRPASDTQVIGGNDVQVEFDMHDPAGFRNWRLFYISTNGPFDVPAGELGTQIRTGSGNSDVVVWNTTAVPFGEYFLGLSWAQLPDTVADGAEEDITTILNPFTVTVIDRPGPPGANSPVVQVTQPSSTRRVQLGADTEVTVEWDATIRELNPVSPFTRVFLDFDQSPGSGNEIVLEAALPVSQESLEVNTQDLELGNYFVGVTVDDGVNAPTTAYAAGRIDVVLVVETLEVTAPDLDLPVKPGTQVFVRWTTNVTDNEADADVFQRRVAAAGQPFGEEIPILVDGNPSAGQTSYVATDAGRFQVSVRLSFFDASRDDLVGVAPSLVQVTSLPLILWVGDLAQFDEEVQSKPNGAIFEGHNFEDNAGSAAGGGEDFNADGIDDFFIVAQYGKPEFVNPTGVGDGELYLLRGTSTTNRYRGSYNLNTVSSEELPGVVLTGIPPEINTDTWGLTSSYIATDADGDGVGELLLGFASVSRIRTERRTGPIERLTMFESGGVVVVSSQNSVLLGSNDESGARMQLERVGMIFDLRQVRPEPGPDGVVPAVCSLDGWLDDRLTYFEGDCPDEDDEGFCEPILPGMFGGCLPNTDPRINSPDGAPDTLVQPTFGFVDHMAVDFLSQFTGFPCEGMIFPCPTCNDDPNHPQNPSPCTCDQYVFDPLAGGFVLNSDPLCASTTDDSGSSAEALTCESAGGPCANQHATYQNRLNVNFNRRPFVSGAILSGFYPDRESGVPGGDDENLNNPQEPFGCRIIGRPVDADHDDFGGFGASISQSGDELIVSAPFRDVVAESDISREAQLTVDGSLAARSDNGGVAYLFTDTRLWSLTAAAAFPKPHMYQAGGAGGFGAGIDIVFQRPTVEDTLGGLRIGGRPDEQIQNIIGIPDFNGDTRSDFVVGAPVARAGDGSAYVIFRRANSLEGDYVLDKLTLDPGSAVRLAGVYVTGNAGETAQFGASLAGGREGSDNTFDFNGDEADDVVIGSPAGHGGTGEVLILFATNQLTSPQDGIDVDTVLAQRRGALITGVDAGSLFGFNIANAGDIDGDGTDDLLIAAPGATPKFDSDPTDDVDELDAKGLDRDLDGAADDVTGPFGVPDGVVNQLDELEGAGLVYVIFGSTDARTWAADDDDPMEISISQLGTAELPGFIIAGRRAGDQLGGGNAATDPDQGNPNKAAGRSNGLAGVGDVDNDGKGDIVIGSVLADPRIDSRSGRGTVNGGEAYLIYGFSQEDR